MTEFLSLFSNTKNENHGVRLPEIRIPAEDLTLVGAKDDASNYEFLRQLCLNGYKTLKIHKSDPNYNEYLQRTKYELETIKDLGFTDYILMVWDVINFCKKNGIPTGLGRGSAGGSLVLYLVGVTKIDPVKYGLYFERFISKTRAKKKIIDGITYLDGSLMCDVDMDICYYRRHEVIQYLEKKYPNRTSKIVTFNTLSSKLLIKELGKIVGGKSDSEMTEVTSMIPKLFGIVADLPSACKEVPEFAKWCSENEMVYKISLKLRDLIKNKGVHPSGIMISYEDLNNICPTELSSDKEVVSSIDMNCASQLCIKLDVLGLRSVSVVDDVCKSVGISVDSINLNDPLIYNSLQDLKTQHGLFQIEADLAYKVVCDVKPKSLEDLSAVLALARPGAMSYIEQFARYSNNGFYEPVHPFFDDILKPTGGICLYQEQLMRMVNKIGFNLDDSEQVRRCVGKKKVEEMAKWEAKIKDKILESKLDERIGTVLWEIAQASANYQFNKSHSLCYAALSAATTYLKFAHPKNFFLSLLKMTKHEPDPISEIYKIQKEMGHFNVKLLRPDLEKSDLGFSIQGNDIRFGLMSIKGISDGSAEALVKFRENLSDGKCAFDSKFDLFEAANKAKINLGVLSCLIQAGCFDTGKGGSRSFNVYQAQLWSKLTDREKVIVKRLAKQFNENLSDILRNMLVSKTPDGKDCMKESRAKTLRRDTIKYSDIFKINKENEEIANWWYETKLLGFSCTASLKDIYSKRVDNYRSVSETKGLKKGVVSCFGGIVSDKPKHGTSKKGSKYIKFTLRDETDEINVMVFNARAEALGDSVKEGELILVKGTSQDEGTVFADIVAVQSAKIYTKLSELRG